MPAEVSGVITLKAEEGDTVQVGAVVCLIDTSAKAPTSNQSSQEVKKESATASTITPASVSSEKEVVNSSVQINHATGSGSPAAEKILREKEISCSTVQGTGKNGRIIKEDAIKATKPSMGSMPIYGSRPTKRQKLSMLRRKVSERLVSVKNETAMLTTFNEVNMKPIFDLRKQYKNAFSEKHGVGLGFMSFFTKAVVRALDLFPSVNAMIDGDYMVSHDFADISIAVSAPKGLMVPVLRNAEKMTFRGIESGIKTLAIKAREGKITVDDMTGGTFTITNGGVFGSMLSTPIINPPQSAILGMHNIVERPMAVEGNVVILPMMYVALSYDHRIIDGKESVGFLVAVKEALENPVELLMNNNITSALEL